MITQEMIDYIDNKYWTYDVWYWSEVYGDVLDYLDKFENEMELTDEETQAIIDCYENLIEVEE